jgi:tRNA(Ile)-lysidine synthase
MNGGRAVDRKSSTSPQKPPLLKCVVETIERYRMLNPGDGVLIGVSGGTDSVALLHLMVTLQPVCDVHLAVAHLNHGLRRQASDREADFVKQLSARLGLPFHHEKIEMDPHRGSLEERARRKRYRFFERIMQQHGYTKLALGHNADDNAESVLLHMLRGSGIRGLAGIPPKRDGRIVRPLIEAGRSDITAYLQSIGESHIEDASNSDMRFLRNRIRHRLIPLLEAQYNPNIRGALNRLAGLCRQEQAWLNGLLRPNLARAQIRTAPECLELDADELIGVPLAAQRRLIRMALREWRGHLRRVELQHVEAVIDLLQHHHPGSRLSLPQSITAERTTQGIRFFGPQADPSNVQGSPAPFSYTIVQPPHRTMTLSIPQAGCRLNISVVPRSAIDLTQATDSASAWFDLDCLDFPLTIRSFQPGDRLAPFGMKGTQKVKKLFIDRKIPRHGRMRIPILAQGDTILWVAGMRRASAAPIADITRYVLKIDIA